MRSKYVRIITVLFAVALVCISVVAASTAAAQCYPDCYPPDPPPSEPSINTGQVWSGFADGRLDPVMDEYYSIWCNENGLAVWGGHPDPYLIEIYEIPPLVNLREGNSIASSSGLSYTKLPNGRLRIAGGNGHSAAGYGEKIINLGNCVFGGIIEAPPPSNSGTGNSANFPLDDPEPTAAELIIQSIAYLMNFCTTPFALVIPFGGVEILRRRYRRWRAK